MRVLLIAFSDESYGTPRAVMDLASRLAELSEVHPTIFTCRTGRISAFAGKNGIAHTVTGHSAFLVPAGSSKRKQRVKRMLFPAYVLAHRWNSHSACARAERAVELGQMDVIHTSIDRDDFGALLARKYGCPHVWHLREFCGLHYPLLPLRRDYIEFMNRSADAFVAVSRAVAEHWVEQGLDRSKVHVIYDGVDQNRFQPGEERELVGELKAAFCGAVNEAKGQIQLIEALRRLAPEERRRVCVDIYGSGPKRYLRFLERKILEYGLEGRVTLRGYCGCLETILPRYDVGVMCSRAEGFGLVTVEYMMCGLCVIASDTGANPELIRHGEHGLLYRYGDPGSLAQCLRYVLAHREQARELGKRARKYACQHFTAEENARRICQLYQSLIGAEKE